MPVVKKKRWLGHLKEVAESKEMAVVMKMRWLLVGSVQHGG